jgi:hypothetical protein
MSILQSHTVYFHSQSLAPFNIPEYSNIKNAGGIEINTIMAKE